MKFSLETVFKSTKLMEGGSGQAEKIQKIRQARTELVLPQRVFCVTISPIVRVSNFLTNKEKKNT